jgi:rhodanese-related sulfurtransferase
MSSSKGKVILGAVLVTVFLFAFEYAQPAAAYEQIPQPAVACAQIPQPGTYENISVQVAHQMIQEDHNNQILILDVRYQCEYNLGHLYGAVLMPYDQLQANISEFQAYKNSVIIVYCKTDVRSTIASEILANNSFTHVYNMLGGIFAWINAGYQIYTTSHYVTVNNVDDKMLTQIEPLLLLQTGAPPCTQNNPCSSSGSLFTYQSTVLEQNGTYALFDITINLNGTIFEFAVARSLLWSWNEDADGYNRSASFTSMDITGQNSFTRFYILGYLVQGPTYNLTIQSVLTPLNLEAYNTSFTTISCMPGDKSGVTSFEFISLNSSVTLSSQYAMLGMVARTMGNLYAESQDKNLTGLAPNYYHMNEEARSLSELVENQLSTYDHEISRSGAILTDACTSQCLGPIIDGCIGIVDAFTIACIIASVLTSLLCGPFWELCIAIPLDLCVAGHLAGIGCILGAIVYCCL